MGDSKVGQITPVAGARSAQVAETTTEEGDQKRFSRYTYPAMRKTQGSFSLDIEAGEFTDRRAHPCPCPGAQCVRLWPVRCRAHCLGPPQQCLSRLCHEQRKRLKMWSVMGQQARLVPRALLHAWMVQCLRTFPQLLLTRHPGSHAGGKWAARPLPHHA